MRRSGSDNSAIRDVMQQARELSVPDRATLAVGLVANLATELDRGRMAALMGELQEEAARVQHLPEAHADQRGAAAESPRRDRERPTADRALAASSYRGEPASGRGARQDREVKESGAHEGVGQGGRGEFRARELL